MKRARQDDLPVSPLQPFDKSPTSPVLPHNNPPTPPIQSCINPPMSSVKPGDNLTAGRQNTMSPTGQLMFHPVTQQFYPPWGTTPSWSSDRDADDENSSSFSRTDIGLMVKNVKYQITTQLCKVLPPGTKRSGTKHELTDTGDAYLREYVSTNYYIRCQLNQGSDPTTSTEEEKGISNCYFRVYGICEIYM